MGTTDRLAAELIALGLKHAKDRAAFNEDLEAYYLAHQDEWHWDGISWDGPYRMWTFKEPARG